MYNLDEINKMLVFDIETVPSCKDINDLTPQMKEVWLLKYHNRFKDVALKDKKNMEVLGNKIHFDIDDENDIFLNYSPLIAEYCKVISISFAKYDSKEEKIDIFSFTSDNELDVLQCISNTLTNFPNQVLTGFNIKGFDIPVICKRFLINGLQVPKMINFRGKKPWEMQVYDLMEDWKQGSWESISLESLTTTLGIPTSKGGDVNGSNIGIKYAKNLVSLANIEKYSSEDAKITLKSILKLSQKPYND